MPAAAHIKAEIEAALSHRIPSALTPAPRLIRPTTAIGIHALDELLHGGLPIGAISEIVGPECSGRTSLSLSFLANLTSQDKVCAWIDVSDSLHPESAAAAGVHLDRLLWVRCGKAGSSSPPVKPTTGCTTSFSETTRVQLGGNSPHPRNESKGMPAAIGDLLRMRGKYKRNKMIGTPGAPNRPLGAPFPAAAAQTSREEQVASDRLPARRGNYVLEQREAYEPRCAEPQPRPRPERKSFSPLALSRETRNIYGTAPGSPWLRMEQALKVTDLLLQGGGFSAIVLDMAGIGPEFASRIPLATWFRYRAAAERTQSSFLLLTQHPCAKSSAGLVLHLGEAQPLEAGATVFAGVNNHAELSRKRFEQEEERVVLIRKPPQRVNTAEWHSRTPWAGRR